MKQTNENMNELKRKAHTNIRTHTHPHTNTYLCTCLNPNLGYYLKFENPLLKFLLAAYWLSIYCDN